MKKERIKQICKAMLEKGYARSMVDDVERGTGYESAVVEFCYALGMDRSEITYIMMNVSTCSEECLERLADQPIEERI